MEVAENFFRPQIDAAFTRIPVRQLDHCDSLRPEKENERVIHNQTVTPPFAAIEGTTFRLNTATTNSRIKSRRPSTRFRSGAPD